MRTNFPLVHLRNSMGLSRGCMYQKPWYIAAAARSLSAATPAETTTTTPPSTTMTTTTSNAPTTIQQQVSFSVDAKIQSFDYTALAACVEELQRSWVPSRVEEAVQYTHSAVALRLRTMERTLWLYLSWHSNLSHIGISEQGPPRGSIAQAFSFGEQMHTALKGLVLTGASLPQPWERTAALEFSVRPGEEPSLVVYVEVVGRYSNVVLTEARGRTVVAAGHQVGHKMSSLRAVYIGKPYVLPPPPQGIPPTACLTVEEFKRAVCLVRNESGGNGNGGGGGGVKMRMTTVLSKCTQTFLGVSPSLVRELCDDAGIPVDADPASLEAAQWDALFCRWRAWLERIENKALTSCSWSPSQGCYSLLDAHDLKQDSPLQFMRSYYGWFESGDEFGKAKQRVTRGITNALVRLQKKIQSLERQSADPSVHQGTSHVADLIMSNMHAITPGATSVAVEDWESGETLTIALDPTKTAIAVAEELYKKARKQRRTVDQVAPLIEECRQQLEYLQEVEVAVEQLEGSDVGDLSALRETEVELVGGGFMKATADASLADKAAGKTRKAAKKGGKNQKSGEREEDYRRYLSPGGFTVLIGRNSKQNDQLSMRVAQPTDVWMHARGVPGAHVLLRVPAGQSAGDDDVQFAADLAAYFSKSRAEGKLDVTMANPVHLQKPRGAKPGQVMVTKEENIVGRPGKSAAALASDS